MRADVGGGRRELVAVGRELGRDVPAVLAFAASLAGRAEVARAAPEEHLDAALCPFVEEPRRNLGASAAICGVDRVCRRRRVGEIRGRDDAHPEAGATRAPQQLADVLHPRVVEGIGRVVGEDAFLIVVGLAAGGVGGHPRRGIGDEGVQRRGHHEARDVQRVHREGCERLAVAHAAGHDAGGRPVRDAHPVTEQEDDVPGAANA